MSELGAAMRQFADAIDAGTIVPQATMCAIVVSDDAGFTKTTYIGRLAPSEPACIILLARGIQQMVEKAQATGAQLSGGVNRGSTH